MKKLMLLSIVLSVTGCSWLYGEHGIIHDRADDYLKAKTEPRLTLPEGTSTAAIQDAVTVPELSDDALNSIPKKFEAPLPPQMTLSDDSSQEGKSNSLSEMPKEKSDDQSIPAGEIKSAKPEKVETIDKTPSH
jgi:uncharacterized lipoprotein